MKIHVLGNPRIPTGLNHRTDPFSVDAYKYIKHLHSYFEMVHYGIPGAEVDCEHVNIYSSPQDIATFNKLAGDEIKKRSSTNDIIACFYGIDNKLACEMNPQCKHIEPNVAYRANGVFAPYRVFTSYANMHMFYGERGMLLNPSWFDAVIPNPFTIDEFEYSENKDDYLLYFGRVCAEKGIALAIQAAEKAGKRLIIAGPGSLKELGYNETPKHVELFGVANPEQRKQLMKNAKALLGLTYYVEPFGNMVIEANLSGTPVITTDWGAFPEIVLEGQTGHRIRDFKSLLTAIENIDKINPLNCRKWGLNFSDEEVHYKHKQYLEKVITGNFYA